MKTLKGQPLKESDYADIRAQLERIFYEVIFKPALDLLAPHNKQILEARKQLKREVPKERRNADDNPVIVAALRSGQIQYDDGEFTGEFNASVSKELIRIGAKFNKRTKIFTLAPDLVPPDVKAMSVQYQEKARQLHAELDKRLAEVQANLENLISKKPIDASAMIGKVQRGYNKSVEDALSHAELSDESKERLKKQYAENIAPYIKKFANETILELRRTIEENALSGCRFESLVGRMQGRYDASKSKAEFLARTETAAYVSKHREQLLTQNGVTQYVWQTAGDGRVREDHRKLNGKVFSYATPPIIDERTGERGNPGMTYNCFPGTSEVNFAYGVRKVYRRWYSGKLTEVVTASGAVIRATPNHPVLTKRGWIAIGLLNEKDYLVKMSDKRVDSSEIHLQNGNSVFSEIFDAALAEGSVLRVSGAADQFHGDGTNEEVEVVSPNGVLALSGYEGTAEKSGKLVLTDPNTLAPSKGRFNQSFAVELRRHCTDGFISLKGKILAVFRGRSGHTHVHGRTPVSYGNVSIFENSSDGRAGNSEAARKSELAFSGQVPRGDGGRIQGQPVLEVGASRRTIGNNSSFSEFFRKVIGVNREQLGGLVEREASVKHFDGVVEKRTSEFSGHVYNLETETGWYCASGFIVANCRCIDSPVVPGMKNYATITGSENPTEAEQ